MARPRRLCAVRTKTMVPQHNKFVLFDSVPCTCGMVCGLVFALLCVKRTLPDRVQLVGPLSVNNQNARTSCIIQTQQKVYGVFMLFLVSPCQCGCVSVCLLCLHNVLLSNFGVHIKSQCCDT